MRIKIGITFSFLKSQDGLFFLKHQRILVKRFDQVCRIIERENPDLDGVLTNTTYNDKRKYPDDRLRRLISHFNSPRLRNSDLESTDVLI